MKEQLTAVEWLRIRLIPTLCDEEDIKHNIKCWEQAKVIEEDAKHQSYLYGHEVGFTKAKEMEKEQCKCGKPRVGGYSCQRTDCNQTFNQ